MSDVLKNLIMAVQSGDEDDIAMALKLAELAGDSGTSSVPTGSLFIVEERENGSYYGPFADARTAQIHADALDKAGAGDAYVVEVEAPVMPQPQPGSAPASQPAIQFDQASGKYVAVGQTIANKPAGSLYSNP